MAEVPTSVHSRAKTLSFDIGRLRVDAMASGSSITKSGGPIALFCDFGRETADSHHMMTMKRRWLWSVFPT